MYLILASVNIEFSGDGSFAKLGVQYITRDPKIGCADSAFSLLVAQILGAQMRTLRTQLHRPLL